MFSPEKNTKNAFAHKTPKCSAPNQNTLVFSPKEHKIESPLLYDLRSSVSILGLSRFSKKQNKTSSCFCLYLPSLIPGGGGSFASIPYCFFALIVSQVLLIFFGVNARRGRPTLKHRSLARTLRASPATPTLPSPPPLPVHNGSSSSHTQGTMRGGTQHPRLNTKPTFFYAKPEKNKDCLVATPLPKETPSVTHPG